MKEKKKQEVINGDHSKMGNEIAQIKASQEKLDNDMRQMMAAFNELMEANVMLAEENKFLKAEIVTLKTELIQNKQELSSLRYDFEELNQYSRKQNIIIEGLPMQKNEDAGKLTTQVIGKLGIQINEANTEACHRLPRSKTKTHPHRLMVVKFHDCKMAAACITKSCSIKHTLSSLGIDSQSNSPVFIREHLTPYTKNLLFQAQKLVIDGMVRFAWCRGGVVFIRRSEGDRSIKVRDFGQLEKLRNGNGPQH